MFNGLRMLSMYRFSFYAARVFTSIPTPGHDLRWEDAAGPRPMVTDSILSVDPGLSGRRNFGQPGENVVGPYGPAGLEPLLPPVQWYEVKDAVQ